MRKVRRSGDTVDRRTGAPALQHPNILFITADDIGLMQVDACHRGIALGETPNIDPIGQEGGLYTQ